MKRNLLLLSLVMALATGCMNQSQIQSKYTNAKNNCRGDDTMWKGLQTTQMRAEANMPVTGYSNCLLQAGWHVAQPKGTAVASNYPPSGAPSTNPSASISSARRTAQPDTAAPARSYQPARPPEVQAAPYGQGAARKF